MRSSRKTCSMPAHCLLNQSPRSGLQLSLAVFHPSMPLRPGLSVFPAATIGGAMLKQIRNILIESGLGVRGLQEIIARQPMDRRTPRGALVGMASKVKMRPLIRCGVNHGLRALISCSFSCPLQCHKTMPELTS